LSSFPQKIEKRHQSKAISALSLGQRHFCLFPTLFISIRANYSHSFVQKEIAATYKYAVSLDPDVMTCSIDDWCLADSIPHVQIKEWIFLQSLENIVAPQFHALLCQARSQKMEGPTDLRALGMELNMNARSAALSIPKGVRRKRCSRGILISIVLFAGKN